MSQELSADPNGRKLLSRLRPPGDPPIACPLFLHRVCTGQSVAASACGGACSHIEYGALWPSAVSANTL